MACNRCVSEALLFALPRKSHLLIVNCRPEMWSVCHYVGCSSVQQLALLGKSLGVRMPPVYEHQWSADGRCQARVAFNNMRFAGSLARTYEQAVESAASLALFNLVRFLTAIRNSCGPFHLLPYHKF